LSTVRRQETSWDNPTEGGLKILGEGLIGPDNFKLKKMEVLGKAGRRQKEEKNTTIRKKKVHVCKSGRGKGRQSMYGA